MMKRLVAIFPLVLAALAFSSAFAEEAEAPCLKSFFTKSLHFTGSGMRYWYDRGFKKIAGVPYDDMDCKTCHISSCDRCHTVKESDVMVFSNKKARDMNTCLPCHSRGALTFMLDEKTGAVDVHVAAGMGCADCHHTSDVHGDGIQRNSRHDAMAVRTTCEECHIDQESESPAYAESISHKVHGDKLSCAVCHVRTSITCYNCHFDSFLKTGEKPGNFIPMKSWTLLLNYKGKVTTGTVQALVHKNKPFVAYAAYHTHSVSSEGRYCEECHNNEALKVMAEGKKVPVVDYREGGIAPWEGVVPLVIGKLQWTFFNKTASGWEPIAGEPQPSLQFVGGALPLDRKQVEKLMKEQTEKRGR